MSTTQRLAQKKGKQKILVNATHPEEMRIAIIFGTELFDLEIEQRNVGHQQQNNIYKGRVDYINPSLNAAFVDFGAGRDGFLPRKHLAAEFIASSDGDNGQANDIERSLREGQELVVQVDKEERDSKGAALTTLIRLPGRNLVLSPNDPRAHGVSRRLSPQGREDALQMLHELDVPAGMSVVLRSSVQNSNVEQLRGELQALLLQWEEINAAANNSVAPQLLLREDDVLVRVLRDWLTEDTDQVLIDTEEAMKQAVRYVNIVAPEYTAKLQVYDDTRPLFNRYHVERQIASAYQRQVPLPAGGDIILERTEAMTVIDVNSSSTKGKGIEEVALTANLEAVAEITRQFRLRDIGGLVVIDFIDMGSDQNRQAVEQALETALADDRTRIHCGRISRFGLLEMTRKRLRPSLREQRDILCPRCDGNGSVRPPRQQALDLLRLLEEEAASRPQAQEVHILVPIDTAAIVHNDYRGKLSQLEQEFNLNIQLFPDPNSTRPHHRFYGERDEVPTHEDAMKQPDSENRLQDQFEQRRNTITQAPLVATVSSEQAWAPMAAARSTWWRQPVTGLRRWLRSDSSTALSTTGEAEEESSAMPQRHHNAQAARSGSRQQRGGGRRGNRNPRRQPTRERNGNTQRQQGQRAEGSQRNRPAAHRSVDAPASTYAVPPPSTLAEQTDTPQQLPATAQSEGVGDSLKMPSTSRFPPQIATAEAVPPVAATVEPPRPVDTAPTPSITAPPPSVPPAEPPPVPSPAKPPVRAANDPRNA